MKRINKQGPKLLGGLVRPPRLDASEIARVASSGSPLVDTRQAGLFAARHIPGTLNIPLNKSFPTWAGSLLPYDRDFYLLIDDNVADRADEATRDLAMIGLDRVAGYFGVDALAAWEQTGKGMEGIQQIRPAELAPMMASGSVEVIDVRGASEWDGGHLPGVQNIPLALLPSRIAEIPRDRPVVLQCQSGGRSAIAASLLRARGIQNVMNLTGGFTAWRDAGLAVENGDE
jgi:hydroxyacylglutathione hydrolase